MKRPMMQTGIPYIGAIPTTWKTCRNKDVFAHSKEIVGDEWEDTQLLSLTTKGIKEKDINNPDGKLPESFSSYQTVHENQLVFCLFDLDQSAVFEGMSHYDGMISPAYTVLDCKQLIKPEFADYWFAFVFTGRKFMYFAKNIRYTMGWDTFSQLSIPIPPLEEQERIVRFLDEETANIDHLIEKYERLLELVAVQAETRWHQLFADLSTCPERPLKRVLQKVTRPAFTGEGVITAFRDGQVTLRTNRREEGFTFSDTEDGYQGIEPGDLVYHGLDGFAGAVGVSDSHGNGSPVYHVCHPLTEQDNVHFLAAYLRFLGLSGFLATQAPNVRQRSVDFRNWETFSRIPIRVPARRDQDEIVTRLEEFKTSRETTEELTLKAIALLRERRSALITAAVTGQIEV